MDKTTIIVPGGIGVLKTAQLQERWQCARTKIKSTGIKPLKGFNDRYSIFEIEAIEMMNIKDNNPFKVMQLQREIDQKNKIIQELTNKIKDMTTLVLS